MKNGLDISKEGTKRWYKDDKLHKEDEPAVEYVDGTLFWYIDGEVHREDGPAIEWDNGDRGWAIKGKRLTETQFKLWQIENRKSKIEALNL